jgi:LCP family protein required for cell wall assembly
MSDDPEEPEYRVYRGGAPSTPAGRVKRPSRPPADAQGETPPPRSNPTPPARSGATPPARSGATPPPRSPRSRPGDAGYTVYRSQPRGVGARLRGETDSEIGGRLEEAERAGARRRERSVRGDREGSGSGRTRIKRTGWARWGRGTWSIRRVIKYVVSLLVAWVLLSAVLFFISATDKAGNIPKSLSAALTKTSAPMLLSAQNVLVLGLDNRPTTTHEPGAETSESDARTDSIMIWRVGGGVSRKLSIPRDTYVDIPGAGEEKINAAWGIDPGLTVKVVENLTGVKINHVIVVDLANFPKFIDDVGGVTVTTPRICSKISGGAALGGFSLYLKAGSHHLNGIQALTLARTRDNACNLAYTDIQREEAQQQILNGIKSQLFSFHAFLHLPWVAWDAPGVVQTDMGAATLLQMFASSEIGGNSKAETLTETGQTIDGSDVLVPNPANVANKVTQLMTGK